MKKILILLAFLSCSTTYGQKLPSDTLAYFDFWVGEWDVTWDEGNGQIGKGINKVTKTLDGKVIQENFEILSGQSAGFKGTSISVYQARLKNWRQSWADNNGGYYSFKAKFKDANRIFQTDIFDLADGKKFTQRMVFKNIKADSFIWDWESSIDGGETWSLNWQINYARRK